MIAPQTDTMPRAAQARTPSQRLISLDVFRGATIAAMMLVNNPGTWSATYQPLQHAPWHGWTFTDLVFPFFLWIVGVAIPLSTARRLEQGQTRRTLFLHALRRAAIIFGLGLFLNGLNYLIDGSLFRDGLGAWCYQVATNIRIPGVLQRIAVCYLITSLVFLWSQPRDKGEAKTSWAGLPVEAVRQAIVIMALLVGYGGLMLLVPLPGIGAGHLDKGENLSGYVDNLLLNGPTIGTHVWKTAKTWDPEGTISTIPAIATCLFGVLTGRLLRSRLNPDTRTAWMFAAGSLLLFLGQAMDNWLPINKNLWTSSYSVFMAGMALVCFGLCYWFIDVQGWRRWAKPFAIYGQNAITVFVLAGVLGRLSLEIRLLNAAGQKVALKTYLYDKFFAPFASPETAPFLGFLATPRNASLLWAIMYVVLLYLVAYVMYRKNWVVKV